MKIDGDIGSAGIKRRRSNAGYRSPGRQSGNIRGDVRPVRRTVLRVPQLTVVRARPDQSFLYFGGSNGENNFSVKLSQVIADDSARRNDAAGVLRREIRTGHRPTLAAIRRLENDLAAVVDDVVVERINGQRRSPVTSIFNIGWR